MVTKAVKFNFGNAFDIPVQKPKAPPPAYGEDDLQAARAASFMEGDKTGYERAMREIAHQTADAASNIATALAALMAQESERRETSRGNAALVGAAIAQKLAPALMRQEPLAEIQSMIEACVETAYTESRLVVRVADCLVDEVKKITDDIAAAHGFAGKFVILGDPQLQGSDCRVEWADGGAERNQQDIDAAIDRIIATYIEARRRAACDPTNS